MSRSRGNIDRAAKILQKSTRYLEIRMGSIAEQARKKLRSGVGRKSPVGYFQFPCWWNGVFRGHVAMKLQLKSGHAIVTSKISVALCNGNSAQLVTSELPGAVSAENAAQLAARIPRGAQKRRRNKRITFQNKCNAQRRSKKIDSLLIRTLLFVR